MRPKQVCVLTAVLGFRGSSPDRFKIEEKQPGSVVSQFAAGMRRLRNEEIVTILYTYSQVMQWQNKIRINRFTKTNINLSNNFFAKH
jgi:hypothetical protein